MADKKKGFDNMIQMDNKKNMKTIIEAAKEQAEKELDEKIELSRRSDIDVRDVFTPEEFDEICRRLENFQGTKADFSKVQLHKKIALGAKWLHEHSIEVTGYKVEQPHKDQPNAIVWIEVRRLSALRDQVLEVFTAMTAMADQMFISGIAKDVIRITFGVERIWDN